MTVKLAAVAGITGEVMCAGKVFGDLKFVHLFHPSVKSSASRMISP
jgi:hypothetical protein